jgi:hypothetical protein
MLCSFCNGFVEHQVSALTSVQQRMVVAKRRGGDGGIAEDADVALLTTVYADGGMLRLLRGAVALVDCFCVGRFE